MKHIFPQVESVLPVKVIGEVISLFLSRHMNLSFYFLSPVQLRRGGIERLWWAPGIQPGSTHHKGILDFL